jgi:hypothetical protein
MRKSIISDSQINLLKQKVLIQAGFNITTKSDCVKLSKFLLNTGVGYISETTIYRLFLKDDNKHAPYKSTLDILCNFIGYADLSLFIESNLVDYGFIKDYNFSDTTLDFLFYSCIKNNNFKSLFEYFEKIEDLTDEVKKGIVLNLFDALTKSDNNNSFFKEFSENKFVREWILELGHDPKFRIANYDEAYLYYLKNTKITKDFNHLQQYVFANAVLFRSSFIRNDFKNASIYGLKLYVKNLNLILSHSNDIHFFPFVRFISYRLWYLSLINSSAVDTLEYAKYLLEFTKLNLINADKLKREILFNTIGEVLVRSNLPISYQVTFKQLFVTELMDLNLNEFDFKLVDLLPQLQPNGLLRHRP